MCSLLRAGTSGNLCGCPGTGSRYPVGVHVAGAMKKKFNNKHIRVEFFRHEDLNKPMVYIDLHGGSSAVLSRKTGLSLLTG